MMLYRAYLRDPQQQVIDKTATNDRNAALAAFEKLISRTDLDGTQMIALLNCNGRPVACHDFQLRPDGSPLKPENHWRGKIHEIKFPAMTISA